MDRSEEISALGGLTGDALAGTVRIVEDVHRAVASRVDAALPAPAKPISAIVRGSTAATYATVRAAHRWIPRGAATFAATRTPPDAPSLLAGPLGRTAVDTVNGIWGPPVTDPVGLTTPMRLLHHGGALPVVGASEDRLDGGAAGPLQPAPRPPAQPSIVVFIHGLAENEASWERQSRDSAEVRPGYAQRLESDEEVTSLALHYSSGRPVGENGVELADLLESVVADWPVPVTTITLVGHSMGGLVARSAAHHGQLADLAWVQRLRLIVTLGTPHLGAPLEQAVTVTERVLGTFPESAPIGRVLGARSHGVRDLHDGRIHADDGAELDPPPVPHVTHCSVGATLTRDTDHPLGTLVGDGLVLLPSAAGRSRTRHIPFHVDRRLGGVSHLALLNEPVVYDLVHGWVREFALG